MNRRSLLNMLIGGAAALALDPEKALWLPGKKLISIPKSPKVIESFLDSFKVGDIITFADVPGKYVVTDVCASRCGLRAVPSEPPPRFDVYPRSDI